MSYCMRVVLLIITAFSGVLFVILAVKNRMEFLAIAGYACILLSVVMFSDLHINAEPGEDDDDEHGKHPGAQ